MTIETVHYCVNLLASICDMWLVKVLAAASLVVLHFFFDGAQNVAMFGVFMLIIMDFITGVAAAAAEGHPIISRKILRTAIKITAYFLAISAGHFTETAVPLPFIDDTIIAFLAATELVSILENLGRSGYAMPRHLLDKLKEFSSSK